VAQHNFLITCLDGIGEFIAYVSTIKDSSHRVRVNTPEFIVLSPPLDGVYGVLCT